MISDMNNPTLDEDTEGAIAYVLSKRASSLNIKERLLTHPCNIGTEGWLVVYSCEGASAKYPIKNLLLSIFIANIEEFSLEMVHGLPKSQADTSILIQTILTSMNELYIAYSIDESKECLIN